MIRVKIKICGVTTPELAYDIAKLGVEYIGIVFHKPSIRYVNIENALAIANAIRLGGAKPVAVVVEQGIEDMLSLVEKTKIDIIQLNGDRSRLEHDALPQYIKRIYVLHINEDGEIVNKEKVGFDSLDKTRDFILFDGERSGSGEVITLSNQSIAHKKSMRFFLAGGINVNNVVHRIKKHIPYAVDLSSSVESTPAKKEFHLIENFIETVSKVGFHDDS